MSPATSPETCVGPIRDDAGHAGDECARAPPNSILSPMGEMSDQSDQDRAGSASGAKSSATSDLEAALTQAASLASDLAVALGEVPPPSASAPSDASPTAPAVDAASLDSELSKLEDLVEETAKEIAPDSGGSSSAVPESMSEPTEQPAGPAQQADGSADESPAPSGDTKGEDASAIAPPEQIAKANLAESVQSGVVGTGMLGVVGNIKKPSPIGRQGVSSADGAAAGDASSDKATPASGPMTRIRAIISERIAPGLYAVSERAVGVLEKIDAPFGRVGGKVRDLIGWVALATVATSILVLILASL